MCRMEIGGIKGRRRKEGRKIGRMGERKKQRGEERK